MVKQNKEIAKENERKTIEFLQETNWNERMEFVREKET